MNDACSLIRSENSMILVILAFLGALVVVVVREGPTSVLDSTGMISLQW